MKYLAIPAFLCLAIIPTSAEEWHFGPFSIQWPDGYTRLPSNSITQFRNNDGILVTVDVVTFKAASPEDVQTNLANARKYATTEFAAVADRHGKVTRPLSEQPLPNGDTLFVVASDGGLFGSHFGLLFLDISHKGNIAQIDVEGSGKQDKYFDQFRALFDTANWSEQ
jgi:hypothetical protein